MKRGNRRLPDAIKATRGTLRLCRTNPAAPVLPTSPWDPPADLKGEGLAEWQRLMPILQEAGVLTDGDRGLFERYCRVLTTLRRVEAAAQRASLEVALAKGYLGQLNKLTTQFRQLAAELGLTPSSRGGVKRAEKAQPGKLEQFMRRVK